MEVKINLSAWIFGYALMQIAFIVFKACEVGAFMDMSWWAAFVPTYCITFMGSLAVWAVWYVAKFTNKKEVTIN